MFNEILCLIHFHLCHSQLHSIICDNRGHASIISYFFLFPFLFKNCIYIFFMLGNLYFIFVDNFCNTKSKKFKNYFDNYLHPIYIKSSPLGNSMCEYVPCEINLFFTGQRACLTISFNSFRSFSPTSVTDLSTCTHCKNNKL